MRSDTFSHLKCMKEIDSMFDSLIKIYKKQSVTDDFGKVVNDFLIRCLEDRKHEL